MRKTSLISLIVFILIGSIFAAPVSAAVLKSGENVTIGKKQKVAEDVYIGARNVTIAGKVEKDATIGAGTVVINGGVGGDATIAGGNVEILGPIGEDLRVGAGSLKITDHVSGDVVVGGGIVELTDEALIDGDLIVGGGSTIIRGTVKGKVRIGGGDVTIDGTLEQDAKVYASNGMTIGKNAVINGVVDYSSIREASVQQGATVNGKLVFSKLESRGSKFGLGNGYWLIIKLFTIIIAALFGLLFFPKLVREISEHGIYRFGPEFLRGLIVLIVTPVVLLVLLATIIGSVLGVGVGFVYLLLLLLAKVFSGMLFGAWIYKVITRQKQLLVDWKVAIFGILLLEIVLVIPIVGTVISALLFTVTFGALAHVLQDAIHRARS